MIFEAKTDKTDKFKARWRNTNSQVLALSLIILGQPSLVILLSLKFCDLKIFRIPNVQHWIDQHSQIFLKKQYSQCPVNEHGNSVTIKKLGTIAVMFQRNKNSTKIVA